VTDVYLSHPDPYSKRMFVGGLLTMIWGSWPLVALAAVAVLDDVSRARLSPPVAWLLTATAATFTAGALGSNRNHFLEWNTALCLAGGLGMARLARLRPRAVGIGLAAAAAAGLAVVAWIPREIGLIREYSQCPQAYDWVRTRAGPDLLSENVGALVLGGKRVWVSNPFALAQMVEHAGWSDEELQRMVRERRFDAIIVRPSHMTGKYRRFTLGVLQAITENYEPRPGYDCLDMGAIYEPKR
jgi:hypothetical protein